MPYVAAGRVLALAAGLALAVAAPAQQMYKWVDEKGVTHFSADPPPDNAKAKAQKYEPKVTPPSGEVKPPSENPSKWSGQEADFRKRQIERGKAEEADAKQAKVRASRCDEAKRKLEWYESGRIYRDNPDGTRVWMEESQRTAKLQELLPGRPITYPGQNVLSFILLAVIVASGTILDGVQPSGSIGGDSLSELIRLYHPEGVRGS